jgi:hypothetical protein
MNASLTIQDEKSHLGTTRLDQTNYWKDEGQPYGIWGGGASGKTSALMYSRWMAKLSGLYQLPWDLNISGTFMVREGWRIPHYFWLEDDSLSGNYVGNWVYTQTDTKDALPTFYNLTLRLEKMIKIGDGRLYLMADMFNVLNSALLNRAYDAYYGDYYVDSDFWRSEPTNRLYNEILNPRVTRFGVRFQF